MSPPSPGGALAGARYLMVGAVATAAHWAAMVACVQGLAMPAWLASGLGAVLGAQLAFVGNRWWTFAHRGPWLAAWWRFMGTASGGAALGMAVVALGTALGLHYLLAQVLATGLVLVLGFLVNRRWTFGS